MIPVRKGAMTGDTTFRRLAESTSKCNTRHNYNKSLKNSSFAATSPIWLSGWATEVRAGSTIRADFDSDVVIGKNSFPSNSKHWSPV